eukprot:GHVU01210828.1.p1 GENE.GHVU01210828.1~~GHVU01210828.1.p1  ORF type:complete len:459 (-),score=72.06 GHVU01210828.1:341-1717(-)
MHASIHAQLFPPFRLRPRSIRWCTCALLPYRCGGTIVAIVVAPSRLSWTTLRHRLAMVVSPPGKYESELVTNWDKFYNRNQANFFKDRTWVDREFKDLREEPAAAGGRGGGEGACRSPTPVSSHSPTCGGAAGGTQEEVDRGGDSSWLLDVNCLAETHRRTEEEQPGSGSAGAKRMLVVDVGCGVGNTLVPLLAKNGNVDAVGVDCSEKAVALLRQRVAERQGQAKGASSSSSSCAAAAGPACSVAVEEKNTHESPTTGREPTRECAAAAPDSSTPLPPPLLLRGRLLSAETWDITQGPLPAELCKPGTADAVLLVFVLSAIPPQYHSVVIDRCLQLLRPGSGVLLFRDYGRLDMAQLRFARTHKATMDANYYVRQDGTLAYYFDKDELRRLMGDSCEELENEYFLREFTNRKKGVSMKRVWVQARFRRVDPTDPKEESVAAGRTTMTADEKELLAPR